MPSIHPNIADRLVAYLEGQLDDDRRRQVEEHLETCGPCAEELRTVWAVAHALREIGRDSLAADAVPDRYGCPGPDELTVYEAREGAGPIDPQDWVKRHLQGCPRCQREVDLNCLLRLELSEPSAEVVPQELSARVEERLMARLRQDTRRDFRVRFIARLASLSPLTLSHAVLGVGLVAIAVWGANYLRQSPELVAQRSSKQAEHVSQPPLAPPVAPMSPPQESGELKEQIGPMLTEAQGSRALSPSVVAKVERLAPSSQTPSLLSESAPPPPGRVPPVVAKVEQAAPVAPASDRSQESLVPSTKAQPKVLVLPIPSHPALRSAVAAGLQDEFGTVQPPDRELQTVSSVEDVVANRRLGRLFGVRYLLEIDVKAKPAEYLVVLRAADTDTGGVVAKREAVALDQAGLAVATLRLAKELGEQLKARP